MVKAIGTGFRKKNWDQAAKQPGPEFKMITDPYDFRVAFKLMVGPARAFETGQPF